MIEEQLVVDLCCGSGGWAEGFLMEGYRVIGFDIIPQPLYPAEMAIADVRGMTARGRRPNVIVASPPCEQFSRHQMPWTKRRNPPEPDLSIVEACWRLAREWDCPILLENVRMAQKWLGPAKWHCGSFYLWGDIPALMPTLKHRNKEDYASSARLERARVPIVLARWIARSFCNIDSDTVLRGGCKSGAW